MLLGSSPIPQSLVTGRTVLIVKDHLKGNIPSNYHPITCLCTVWKLLTSVLRFILCRHLNSVGEIPFQQKGTHMVQRGAKLIHLLINL